MNKKENKGKKYNSTPQAPWSFSWKQVFKRLSTDPDTGLDKNQITRRKKKYGGNVLMEVKTKSALTIFLQQFKSLIMLLLALAALLSFLFMHWTDGIAIIVAIFVNAGIGFFMELKAVRTMESLRRYDRQHVRVLRDGRHREIPASQLVPGDIVFLEGGDTVPADMRLFEAANLQVNESVLTGEAAASSKQTQALKEKTVLAERTNLVFKGTSVTRGSGKAIVYGTGMNTEIGRISSLVKEAGEEEDPLEARLNRLGQRLIWLILAVVAASGALGVVMQRDLLLMIELTIVLAVAAVPEGLPIVESVSLAKGMRRMAGHNALVRRLPAVQTLGSTTVILTDKTGTLTENQMTVTRLELPDGKFTLSGQGLDADGEIRRRAGRHGEIVHNPLDDDILRRLLEIGVLCNNAALNTEDGEAGAEEDSDAVVGDPTEVALLVAGRKVGLERKKLLKSYPELKEVAFDPEEKRMATIHEISDDKYLFAVKGAPDTVLSYCSAVLTKDGVKKMSKKAKDKWLNKNDRLAKEGLRLLAAAYKETSSSEEEPYDDLILSGLFAMHDPPREDIKSAIRQCQNAGVRVVMVTGDQKHTAHAVGTAMNITEGSSDILHGNEFGSFSSLDRGQKQKLMKTSVFARISPEQKQGLVSLYKQNGEIVAMTGDGVNDAPALKKADIGIAMGKRGDQVAKDAADIILLNDLFTSIVKAIEYGRTIFNNIRKFVIYLISGNLGEIIIVSVASLLGLPIPLLPLQILYLNAINDVFPALALGVSEGERSVMNKPPRDPREPILTKRHWKDIVFFGLTIGAAALVAFLTAHFVLHLPFREVSSITFINIAFARLWHVFNMRDRDTSFLKNQIMRNPFVWAALVLCVVLIVSALFIPGLNTVLSLTVPSFTGWLLVVGMSLLPLCIGQVWIQLFSHTS